MTRYWRVGKSARFGVERLPGHPTSFVTVWVWKMKIRVQWRAV